MMSEMCAPGIYISWNLRRASSGGLYAVRTHAMVLRELGTGATADRDRHAKAIRRGWSFMRQAG
jgi:hypothetical protein